MGLYDEHWCSKCKKQLDKTKDKYVEVNMINEGKRKAKQEGKHTRVFLCKECLKKEENMNELIESLRKHANPNFRCSVFCESLEIDKMYEIYFPQETGSIHDGKLVGKFGKCCVFDTEYVSYLMLQPVREMKTTTLEKMQILVDECRLVLKEIRRGK